MFCKSGILIFIFAENNYLELFHLQGAAGVRVQEDREELLHVQGQ